MFGCLAYAHNQRCEGDKFASQSQKCIFIGYAFGKKGWSMYDVETSNLFVSRDMVFIENQFLYLYKTNEENGKTGDNTIEYCLVEEELKYHYKMREQERGDEQNQDMIETYNNT